MSTSKILLGIIAGVAVGAAAGILTAPDSGVNTRKKISEKSQGYANDLQNKVNNFKNGFKSSVNTVKDDVHMIADQAKTKLGDHAKKAGSYNS
ncbi:MAG: YtxH domain-containing protein [Saprospiraceae bacterium]|uniref:YtxH domain-containing protein n=1 Tax=Candidatus Opimibacter skivensis TaxID=2982028 RepID=A0A9D7XSW1_9BACT|nr:YtxH domain-containing protein [Candidatus Opimibacter skivensis]